MFFAFAFVSLVNSNPPNFDFDFTGFTQLTQLLPTTCSDIVGQVCQFNYMSIQQTCAIFLQDALFIPNFSLLLLVSHRRLSQMKDDPVVG